MYECYDTVFEFWQDFSDISSTHRFIQCCEDSPCWVHGSSHRALLPAPLPCPVPSSKSIYNIFISRKYFFLEEQKINHLKSHKIFYLTLFHLQNISNFVIHNWKKNLTLIFLRIEKSRSEFATARMKTRKR